MDPSFSQGVLKMPRISKKKAVQLYAKVSAYIVIQKIYREYVTFQKIYKNEERLRNEFSCLLRHADIKIIFKSLAISLAVIFRCRMLHVGLVCCK